jgi:hypothetical protein
VRVRVRVRVRVHVFVVVNLLFGPRSFPCVSVTSTRASLPDLGLPPVTSGGGMGFGFGVSVRCGSTTLMSFGAGGGGGFGGLGCVAAQPRRSWRRLVSRSCLCPGLFILFGSVAHSLCHRGGFGGGGGAQLGSLSVGGGGGCQYDTNGTCAACDGSGDATANSNLGAMGTSLLAAMGTCTQGLVRGCSTLCLACSVRACSTFCSVIVMCPPPPPVCGGRGYHCRWCVVAAVVAAVWRLDRAPMAPAST